MQISNRLPREKRFGLAKKNSYHTKCKNHDFSINNNKDLVMRGAENLPHPKLREIQRYCTSSVNRKNIVESIRRGNAVTIKEDLNSITALVRHSSRYYIVVMDKKLKAIKTFLPDNISNFLDYVQKLIDKEHMNSLSVAA